MQKLKESMKGNFAKSVIVMTGGAVFAQAMNFLLSPVVTRIYSPEDYGILTVYGATLAMFSLVGALSYELAIPIAEDDEKAINVLALCIIVLIGITGFIGLLLIFQGRAILEFLNAMEIYRYRYFLPIGFFSIGMYMTLSSWAFRRKDFSVIAKTNYSQSIAGNLTKIGLGLLSFGPVGLLIGRIMAESASIVPLLFSIVKKEKPLFKTIYIEKIKWAAKRYVKFPTFSAPTVFLTSLSSQIPVILMSGIYGPQVVGHYGLALTVTFLPVTLIGKAVQDVYYGESASIGNANPERIKVLSDKLMKKLVFLAGAPMLILLAFGPVLFSIVFGSDWGESGEYSRLLTVYMFAHFIFHPSSAVFIVFEKQRQTFFLNVFKLTIVLIIFQFVRILNMDSKLTILIFSISMAFVELAKYILAQRILRRAVRDAGLSEKNG